jgi:antirestriction protein ArdC
LIILVDEACEGLPETQNGEICHVDKGAEGYPIIKNTGLVDTVGGSAVFYQSQVKLVKLSASDA